MSRPKRLRSPIVWFGGKGRLAPRLLPYLPQHKTYVEPFGGGGSLLLAKRPSPVEVYNDLDAGLVHFFRTLRQPELFMRFHHLATLTPHSREEYFHCLETWEQSEDPAERAWKWFVVARMSFSGRFGSSISMNVGNTARGMAGTCSRWLSTLEMLPAIAERMQRVQIEHLDCLRVLELYDTPETLFYCDPPYLPTTRRGGVYLHDMDEDAHRLLLERLEKLEGMVALSGYKSRLYQKLEAAGWRRVELPVNCSAAGRTRWTGLKGAGSTRGWQDRLECFWLNHRAWSRLDSQGPFPLPNKADHEEPRQ